MTQNGYKPDADARTFPDDRKRTDKQANVDTLLQELSVVAERHKGPLDATTIAQTLYDFADSYADVWDVPIGVKTIEAPDGAVVTMVTFTESDKHAPAPIGKWKPEHHGWVVEDPELWNDHRNTPREP